MGVYLIQRQSTSQHRKGVFTALLGNAPAVYVGKRTVKELTFTFLFFFNFLFLFMTFQCKPDDEEVSQPDCKGTEFVNPFWEPKIIVMGPCQHCWLTNSLKNPFHAGFIVLVSLLTLGMVKMLVAQTCCRTKDGRPIDVVGVILGTTSIEHTRRYL